MTLDYLKRGWNYIGNTDKDFSVQSLCPCSVLFCPILTGSSITVLL